MVNTDCLPGNEKAATEPNVKESSPRLFWRIRPALNQQKVTIWDEFVEKIKKYNVRSWNVYENKESMDTMPDEKPDTYVDTTIILQKVPVIEGQFDLNNSFGACF